MAECPVLVARKELPAQGAQRILAAVDFSPDSDKALSVLPWVAAKQAEIELFHVWNLPMTTIPYYSGLEQMEGLGETIKQGVKERGAKLLDKITSWAPGARFESVQGFAVDGIIQRLEARKYDLAVLGSHSRSGASRWFLGSVAEKVIRHAPCSVLVVPPRAA
jgi:nucleotide-binding universal stress UspA family protein